MIEPNSDASATIGIGNRIGAGEVRHIAVTQQVLNSEVNDIDGFQHSEFQEVLG